MKRCHICYGSGRVMGGGMIIADCDVCDGRGKIYEEQKLDDNNPHYNEAIEKIKNLNENITHEDAKNIFQSELDKINKKERKNKHVKTNY